MAKLEPDRDVQIVPMAVDAMGPMVLNRKVDGAMTLEPFTTQALLGEETKVLVNTVDAVPHHPWYLVAVRTEFLQQHRETVVKVVRAHVEAVQFLNAHPAEANELIARAFKLEPVKGAQTGKVTPPADVARAARERIGFEFALNDNDLEFFERQLGWARELGFVKSAQKASSLVDRSLLREVAGGR
jgi:NitT/TauT family transport system substrate-binding protein